MTEPAPATPRPARRFPRWVARLGRSGVPEAIVGLFAYMYNEAFPSIDGNRTLAEAIVDFLLCFFAALTGRWPRVGTLGVAATLIAQVLVSDELSVTVFAMFVPIVSNGAHGRTVLRDIAAPLYFALAIVKTMPLNDTLGDQLQTVIIWAVLVGLAWGTGRTIHRLRREGQEQAELRTAALRSQRRSIARDLHDTVSYATTTMIMRAEQIKLRVGDDPQLTEDLDFIIATGRRSVRDLRGMMETLRRNDPELDLEQNTPWRLLTVTDVIAERQAELAAHGLTLQVTSDADLDSLPSSVRETLAKLVVEATSNMVKHAGKGPCRLIIEVQDDTLEAVFTNRLRAGHRQDGGRPGLGLVGAAERVRAIGGELEATAASGTWILRAQLPIGE
ncbi:hypothetical protein J4N02_15550 [Propioniciclava sp. MC1595]|uniref:sensor histidine kinase n=1 Tax=Propioniciclava sp. MC1595 TaxID=2760308 RepID=UPI001662406A|nr:histidine kinase [Propioniciclava sp. MC1595]MBB1494808.1 hypothetical protein [Propioniciclava sp. MC1595]QTE25875.1 hypothetical protein J4N02_15550 [Propioniciclava sp. MC1595]